MKKMRVTIPIKNITIGESIFVAESFMDRMKGLMFSEKILGDGLLIQSCNSVHTFFMKYSLDLLFLDRHYKIIKIIRNLSPWRATFFYFKASMTLELVGGTLPLRVVEGDQMEVTYV